MMKLQKPLLKPAQITQTEAKTPIPIPTQETRTTKTKSTTATPKKATLEIKFNSKMLEMQIMATTGRNPDNDSNKRTRRLGIEEVDT